MVNRLQNLAKNESVLALGRLLRNDGYRFVTPTPATHSRVISRRQRSSSILRDVFGWNREFQLQDLPDAYQAFVREGDYFRYSDGHWRSKVRFSSLSDFLFGHSGFPTADRDSVFFGPDTYRFCRTIAALKYREPDFSPNRAIDIGAGSGAGGVFATSVFPSLSEVILSDVNDRALAFSQANAALNDISNVQVKNSDILTGIDGSADLILSNPPYLVDAEHRQYRDGGGRMGEALAIRILAQALPRLAPGGHLLLYTGAAIVEGKDVFFEAAKPVLEAHAASYRYEELDPDVFGEELGSESYSEADRIASVLLNVKGEQPLR